MIFIKVIGILLYSNAIFMRQLFSLITVMLKFNYSHTFYEFPIRYNFLKLCFIDYPTKRTCGIIKYAKVLY